ncbi:MAG: CYCXC family (seleno)protein [Acidobacteriaceae bacterium]
MLKRGLMLAVLFALTITISPTRAISQQEAAIPAFNAGPPAKGTKLPAILGKDQLWAENTEHPYQSHAYELAAKIPVVLHQQPCYCYCDRMGHKSLHSCFESTHGAQCSICLKELYYSYSMHKRGRSAAQIRQGIIKGEWKTVDLQTASSIN